jgi:hypothetical protein
MARDVQDVGQIPERGHAEGLAALEPRPQGSEQDTDGVRERGREMTLQNIGEVPCPLGELQRRKPCHAVAHESGYVQERVNAREITPERLHHRAPKEFLQRFRHVVPIYNL